METTGRRRRSSSGRGRRLATAVAIAALVAWVGGCADENRFYCAGEYVAPKSGFLARVAAEGMLRPGLDLSDRFRSITRFCPAGAGRAEPLLLEVSETEAGVAAVAVLGPGAFEALEWGTPSTVPRLASLLSRAGYPASAPEELEEVVRVIGGAGGGPKSVVLEGQTSVLEIAWVRHGRPSGTRASAVQSVPPCDTAWKRN